MVPTAALETMMQTPRPPCSVPHRPRPGDRRALRRDRALSRPRESRAPGAPRASPSRLPLGWVRARRRPGSARLPPGSAARPPGSAPERRPPVWPWACRRPAGEVPADGDRADWDRAGWVPPDWMPPGWVPPGCERAARPVSGWAGSRRVRGSPSAAPGLRPRGPVPRVSPHPPLPWPLPGRPDWPPARPPRGPAASWPGSRCA